MKMKKVVVFMALTACVVPAASAEDEASMGGGPSTTVTAGRLAALEARLAELESQGGSVPAGSGFSDKIKINGFMSAGMGYADVEGYTYDNGLTDVVGYKPDAIMGLQFEAKVNEQVNAMVQLVARGPTDYKAEAEWAYIGYRPTQNDEFRVGRIRSAFYMMSEYLEVGYAYPWARPPAEYYLATFPSSLDGVSWLHRFDLGGWEHDLQISLGNTKSPEGQANQLDADDGGGLSWVASHGNWQFKANYAESNLTARNTLFTALTALRNTFPAVVTVDTHVKRADIAYTTLGLQYDNGGLLVMAEAAQNKIEGFLADSESAYGLVGYRFGKVMPHVTWARIRSSDKDKRPDMPALPTLCPAAPATGGFCIAETPALNIPFPPDLLSRLFTQEQESITLGVRYDFLSNAAIKLDWTRVTDTAGTFGLFTNDSGKLLGAPPDDDVDIFRLVVDVVF